MKMFVCIIIVLLWASVSFAGEASCLDTNARMTDDMERAASASRAGDMCRAADFMDSALYWAMKCETECAYSRDRLRKAINMKEQIMSALAKLVQLCGH